MVLSLLRTALGTATSPPNSVVISLALFLTAFVMGPVLTRVYDVGIKPLVANEINVNEAFERASGPLRGFMEKNVREKDLRLFVDMSGEKAPQKPEDLSMRILIPAFMISELKLYRARFFGHKFELSSFLHGVLLPGDTRLTRAA